VQQVMQDIERAQSKGDTSEEELKALEYDVTGKIMLASWRGTRFEVVQVLREVRPDSHSSDLYMLIEYP
jgi:X-domain of DnaJ-containing